MLFIILTDDNFLLFWLLCFLLFSQILKCISQLEVAQLIGSVVAKYNFFFHHYFFSLLLLLLLFPFMLLLLFFQSFFFMIWCIWLFSFILLFIFHYYYYHHHLFFIFIVFIFINIIKSRTKQQTNFSTNLSNHHPPVVDSFDLESIYLSIHLSTYLSI